MVGWLGGQWSLEPTKVKVPVLAFILCAFSGRRRSTRLRGTYGDFVKSQDHMLAHSLEGAHRGRVPVCALIAVSACVYI